jgi:hypothetical protein
MPIKNLLSQVWWFRPVIPALRRLQQEDLEFETSLSCLKKTQAVIQG